MAIIRSERGDFGTIVADLTIVTTRTLRDIELKVLEFARFRSVCKSSVVTIP